MTALRELVAPWLSLEKVLLSSPIARNHQLMLGNVVRFYSTFSLPYPRAAPVAVAAAAAAGPI